MMDKTTTKSKTKQVGDKNLFTLSPAILPDEQRVIRNFWGKKVSNPNAIVFFKGEPILRAGGKLIIKSLPKAGKTSVDEAMIANYLNPEAVPMGFSVKLYGRTKILFIDTEQSEYESQQSYNRIMKRCNYDLSGQAPEEVERLIHINLKRLHPDEMLSEITKILNNNPEIGLILFDVVTDLSDDNVMEMKDALKVTRLLNSINEDIGLICNIHVNVGDALRKPARGHLGRELERKCSACIYLTKEAADTIKIELDLNRTGGNGSPVYCTWNDKLGLFAEADYKPINIDRKDKHKEEVAQIFGNEKELTTKKMKERFFAIRPNTGVKNYDYHVKEWAKHKLIEAISRGNWRILDV
jgi:hypothetical protein